MPRIVALLPNGVASVDVGHYACRIDLATTTIRGSPAFSLVYRYPPNPVALMQPDGRPIPMAAFGVVALARASAQGVARAVEELDRVVEVSLDGGTREKDIARMTEAYQLFRNGPARGETIDACVKDSAAILDAYWSVREWMEDGMREAKKLDVLTGKLALQP